MPGFISNNIITPTCGGPMRLSSQTPIWVPKWGSHTARLRQNYASRLYIANDCNWNIQWDDDNRRGAVGRCSPKGCRHHWSYRTWEKPNRRLRFKKKKKTLRNCQKNMWKHKNYTFASVIWTFLKKKTKKQIHSEKSKPKNQNWLRTSLPRVVRVAGDRNDRQPPSWQMFCGCSSWLFGCLLKIT